MTQNKKSQALLYFKEIIENYSIKLNKLENKEFDNSITVLISILNYIEDDDLFNYTGVHSYLITIKKLYKETLFLFKKVV